MYFPFVILGVALAPVLVLVGSDAIQITTDSGSDVHPAWSPDGTQIAFTSNRSGLDNIWVVSVAGGPAKQLTVSGGTQPDWSLDGSTIAFTGSGCGYPFANCDIWTIPASGGSPTQVTNNPAEDQNPSWFPGGSKIAFHSFRGGNWDIWTITVPDGVEDRITTHSGSDRDATWSPDGSHIAFDSSRNGSPNLFVIPVSGGDATQITFGGWVIWPDWSPGGTRIAYSLNMNTAQDVWVVPALGGTPVQINTDPAIDGAPSWSPDGSQIAFHSSRSGNFDIWIIPVPSMPTGVERESWAGIKGKYHAP